MKKLVIFSMEIFMKKNALFNVAAVAALGLLSACGCGSECEKGKEQAQAEQNVQLAENTVATEGVAAEVAVDAAPVLTDEMQAPDMQVSEASGSQEDVK
jgi:hypothetical protein